MEKLEFYLLGKEKLKKEANNEGLQTLKAPDLFPKSFICLLIGKPGSGKTTLIEEMLINPVLLNNQFDFIFIFSPNELKNIPCIQNENYSNLDIENILTDEKNNNDIEIYKIINNKIIEQYNEFTNKMIQMNYKHDMERNYLTSSHKEIFTPVGINHYNKK
jgi:adenylate kinase